jgi:hypothetical protein
LTAYRLPVMDSIQTLLKLSPDTIKVYDPFPLLCPGNFCEASNSTKPLFTDGDHISTYGNVLLYPSFEKFMNNMMLNRSIG